MCKTAQKACCTTGFRVTPVSLRRNSMKEFMRMIANKQSLRELAMLQYQAEKYRLAGNGFMSQHLNSQIRKLQEQLADSDKN